jgi:putative copper export protein
LEFYKVLNFWIHLVSAFIWVGGILFNSLVLLPTLRSKVAKEIGEPFLLKLHTKFTKISIFLVSLILVTGTINIKIARGIRMEFSQPYFFALSFKILLFTLLLSIFVLNLKNLSEANKKTGMPYIPFQDTSMILGVLIILMAAFLKHAP